MSSEPEQWAVELFRKAVEAYGGATIPGETECYAARVIQRAFEERERKLREECCCLIPDTEDHRTIQEIAELQETQLATVRQALKETPDAQ